MRITIGINANSRKEEIVRESENQYKVKFFAKREKGKANEKLIGILSEYFGVAKVNIKIIRGHKSSNKILEIQL